MTRVLIADNDLDSHELIDDLIEINFRDVSIDHAITIDTFQSKIADDPEGYHLILFNLALIHQEENDLLDRIRLDRPDLFSRMVFLAPGPEETITALGNRPVIRRPFSLDEFSDVVKGACGDR